MDTGIDTASWLITGGAGFIGSALAGRMLKEGYPVIILDNFNHYYDVKLKQANIARLMAIRDHERLDANRLRIVEGDILEPEALNMVFSHRLQGVVHLAAMAGVRYSMENPRLYTRVNVEGTLALLEECRKHNIRSFVFSSSSSVYGNDQVENLNNVFSGNATVSTDPATIHGRGVCETDSADFPLSPYAATKRAGELLCHTYHKLYDISMVCLRFFTVYGPGQRPDLAIHKFARLIADGQELPIYGDGSSCRDYTYVEDIVDGIFRAMALLSRHEREQRMKQERGEDQIQVCAQNKALFEIYNLGRAQPVSLLKLISLLEKQMHQTARLRWLPQQPGDVDRTCANIDKARRELGYNPSTELADGIRSFLDWFSGQRSQ